MQKRTHIKTQTYRYMHSHTYAPTPHSHTHTHMHIHTRKLVRTNRWCLRLHFQFGVEISNHSNLSTHAHTRTHTHTHTHTLLFFSLEMQALILAVRSNQATHVYVCSNLKYDCVGWVRKTMTVHVSVCLCLYVCPFLHECVDTPLFIDQFCFCPSSPRLQ